MITKSFLLSSIPLLIDLYAKQYREYDLAKTRIELAKEVNVPNITTYDFIIVGGGTSGCVLAGRLSEQYSVLLLEAGGDPPPATAVPYYTDYVRKESSIKYCYKTVPMKGSSQSSGGVVTVCTGKMLGGSGSHNQMIYNRGSPYDYDNWGKLTNDSSWNYNNVLKFFKKLENFTGERFGPLQDDQFYGDDGPIHVKLNKVPILPLWFKAGLELGFVTQDPNGNQTESFTALYKAVNSKGQRSSSYKEYVERYEKVRKNLNAIRYANVSEILLDENNTAYGVAYTRHELFPQIAYASKEVILCAGTFSSPLLLIKSGIGPVKTLNDAQIPVKVALEAVGKNLKEHAAVILQNFSVNDSSLFPRIFSNEVEHIVEQYHQSGEGILATIADGPQCFKISQNSESNYWPDLWIEMYPIIMTDNESQQINFNVILGRPKSKGILSFNTDAYKKGIRDDIQLALIDYKFFSNPVDVETMVEGIKLVLKIAENTSAFQSLQMKYNSSPDQACILHQFRSDDYWRCFIRQKTHSWTHMVGTCSMGPESGNSHFSVVDNRLRVRGVNKLRICDASVIPAVTNANLNTPVLMVAEKAADMILTDWSLN